MNAQKLGWRPLQVTSRWGHNIHFLWEHEHKWYMERYNWKHTNIQTLHYVYSLSKYVLSNNALTCITDTLQKYNGHFFSAISGQKVPILKANWAKECIGWHVKRLPLCAEHCTDMSLHLPILSIYFLGEFSLSLQKLVPHFSNSCTHTTPPFL